MPLAPLEPVAPLELDDAEPHLFPLHWPDVHSSAVAHGVPSAFFARHTLGELPRSQ